MSLGDWMYLDVLERAFCGEHGCCGERACPALGREAALKPDGPVLTGNMW